MKLGSIWLSCSTYAASVVNLIKFWHLDSKFLVRITLTKFASSFGSICTVAAYSRKHFALILEKIKGGTTFVDRIDAFFP